MTVLPCPACSKVVTGEGDFEAVMILLIHMKGFNDQRHKKELRLIRKRLQKNQPESSGGQK